MLSLPRYRENRRFRASYFAWSVLLLALLPFFLLPVGNILAQTPDLATVPQVSLDLDINLDLTAKQPLYGFKFKLANATSTEILQEYKLPNVWKLQQLFGQRSEPSKDLRVSLDADYIKLNFLQPLLPGETMQLDLSAEARTLGDRGPVKYLRHGSLNAALGSQADGVKLQVKSYLLRYPKPWGTPRLNLRELAQQPVDSGAVAAVNISPVEPVLLTWEQPFSAEINYTYGVAGKGNGGTYLKSLLRNSAVQRAKLLTLSSNRGIYRDVSGNNYIAVDYGSQTRSYNDTLRLEYNPAATHSKPKSLASEYPRFQLSEELAKLVNRLEDFKTDHDALVSQTVLGITEEYKVKPLDFSKFSLPLQVGSQQQLDYGEYLAAVNQLLTEVGVGSQIVLLDRALIGGNIDFLAEICEETCKYYRLTAGNEPKREVSPLGVQLLAFDGYNQLAVEKIHELDALRAYSVDFEHGTVAGATSESEAAAEERSGGNELRMELELPADISSYSPFSAVIKLDNNTSEVIFLDNLQIEGSSYPIADSALFGLHEAVLPGQRKSFTVPYLSIQRLFAGDKLPVDLDLAVNYSAGDAAKTFASKQRVQLKQNYALLALLLIFILSCAVSIFILRDLHSSYKHLWLNNYWRVRRTADNIWWWIKQRRER